MKYVIRCDVYDLDLGWRVITLGDNNGWYSATACAMQFTTSDQARHYWKNKTSIHRTGAWIQGPRGGRHNIKRLK